VFCLDDFETPARRFLPSPIFGYVAGGSETGAALIANRNAFAEYEFLPRVLINTHGSRHQGTTIFGHAYSLPFGFAPMGQASLAAYNGDCVLAKAAAELNTIMIHSGASLTSMEHVRRDGATTWFQAYLPGEPDTIASLLDRAARSGFEVLVLAVDVPVPANRENNQRSGYSVPGRLTPRLAGEWLLRPRWLFGTFARTILHHGMPHLENMDFPRIPIFGRTTRPHTARDALSWEHVELVRRIWKGKFVLKGVLADEDVRIARESGVDGILISNHGGRQLDYAVAPLRALPVAASEAGDMTIMLDGGIRRGTDVLKAFALGAHFVFVGRPFLYAVSIAGEAGVHHAASLLRAEIDRDMAMLGIASLIDMKREHLVPSRGPIQAHPAKD
jgi:L-lactate dehydrogenase (cytochrome)